MEKTIKFELNGKPVEVTTNPDDRLLWVLRNELEYTGTKFGCGIGVCGACTVIVDDEAVRSCTYTIADVEGRKVLTIEGLANGDTLHPIQQAFVNHDALQCGFCTPGMIMNAYALLLHNPDAAREEIIEGMGDNLCRCGTYNRILDALEEARVMIKQGVSA